MTLFTLLLSVLITGLWSDDLLFFDEFEFDFDLNNQNEWDNYNIKGNNNDYLSSISKETNKNYIHKLYNNEQILNEDKNLFSKLNYASKCSETIPLILKQLCVHWKYDQGFKYNYKIPNNDAKIQDTNWYYNDNDNIISDAKTAENNDIRYIGDDNNWNEINYANSLSTFMFNDDENEHDYFENFGEGSFKQCRHEMRMRECVSFDLPSKKLTVNVKIARARKHRHNIINELPNNIYTAQQDVDDEYADYGEYDDNNEINSAYDYHGEFEYGDSMGYDHWSANIMKWKTFNCLNCNNNNNRRRVLDKYDKYGDFTYLFNEYSLDFDNNNDWNEISNRSNYIYVIFVSDFKQIQKYEEFQTKI